MRKQIQNLIQELRATDDLAEQEKIKQKIDKFESLLFNEN